MADNKRSKAQVAADEKYENKRATLPRFGGRCTEEEKALLTRLTKEEGGLTEKELIFKALRFYEERR